MRLTAAICLLIAFEVQGQEDSLKSFRSDFQLTVDNDAFLAQAIDRYYSSGIFFKYRQLIPESSSLVKLGGSGLNKAYFSIGFTHLFFTPSDLKLRTIDQLDRPYAGMMSVNFGLNFIRNDRSKIALQLDGGIMGPAAGVRELQEWYHCLIGAKKPRGWRFQIENSPLISLEFEYLKSLLKTGNVEIFGEGKMVAGTVFNTIKPGLSIRWGKFQPLSNTTFASSRLGSINSNDAKSDWKESYFYIKTAMTFVPYDATVEGNFIGNESIHTEETQRLRYHIKYGWNLGLKRWDFGLAFNNVRRETKEARDHYYITIDVLMRI